MKEPNANREPMDEARLQAMNAAQWLARLTCSYEANAEDIELRWDRRSGRIVTPEIAPGVAVGMSLPTLVLQFDENGKPSPHPIDVDGKSSTEVEAWILIELLHRGIDRDRFSKVLPYDLKDLMSGEEPKYSPQDLGDELQSLSKSFGTAADVLTHVSEAMKRKDTGSSDLVCWPERMELGFSVPTFGNDPAHGTIQVGFSAGDSEDSRPRFFVRRGRSSASSAEPSLLPMSDISDKSPADLRDLLLKEVKAVKARAAS